MLVPNLWQFCVKACSCLLKYNDEVFVGTIIQYQNLYTKYV